jgi:hypothetical protein
MQTKENTSMVTMEGNRRRGKCEPSKGRGENQYQDNGGEKKNKNVDVSGAARSTNPSVDSAPLQAKPRCA